MSTSTRTSKAARHTGTDAPAHSRPGPTGAALAPQPCGIDFVDRGLLEKGQGRGQGQGLPSALRNGIESLSGLSMDHVRVHYNSSRPAEVGTMAYAQGSEIHVAPGQEQHLPHEAWHVVQQAQGRVVPTTRAADGRPVNDQMLLEREADAMGARALPARRDATPHTGLAVAPAPGGSAAAVIQCWPPFIDRWLERRKGFTPVEDPDRPLVQESKVVGHQAQTAVSTVEANRRGTAFQGLVQVGEEGIKMGLDAVGTATVGVPIGSIVGGVRSAQSIVSSGHGAYRETGSSKSAVRAVGKELLKTGVGEAVGNIPVIGELIGMVEGLVTVFYSVVQSDKSRFEEKQTALIGLIEKGPLIEQARQRLREGDLEAHSQSRLEKAVKRYEGALAKGRTWQQGKVKGSKFPLLAHEIEDD